jgi:Ni,Fe-hydrogenase III large subunit/Ni,Fe-hydrogenase III component G
MPLRGWYTHSEPPPGAPGLRALTVGREEWRRVAEDLAAAGGRLMALWASRDERASFTVRAVFLAERFALVAGLRATDPDTPYPGIQDIFPAAARMQRATADLSGLRSTDSDTRPWLRHTAWTESFRPLTDPPTLLPEADSSIDTYDFVRVEGEGVHEIAVGPVHAGIIEPGHFRFSVVGEKVLKLEERLGYVHKGIERRFTELSIFDGHRLAARVSGDSAVAFSWAYCQALEGISGATIPPRAVWLRALCLELERIANHLGDLGALGNDAGFAFGLAQFSRLKEHLLRATQEALGARYLMSAIIPGGTRLDLTAGGAQLLATSVRKLATEALSLRAIYDEHEGVRDRFSGAGAVAPELAARLGLIGLAGRASGQAHDLRIDLPCEPYAQLAPAKCGSTAGDVAARVAVRFDELLESCRLIQCILERMPSGAHISSVRTPADGAFGVGMIEGWRGPVLVGLEAGAGGTIRRCHPHDPSWQNWPVLEHAIIGNIVPDFPLINKSFNLSYSGHDL